MLILCDENKKILAFLNEKHIPIDLKHYIKRKIDDPKQKIEKYVFPKIWSLHINPITKYGYTYLLQQYSNKQNNVFYLQNDYISIQLYAYVAAVDEKCHWLVLKNIEIPAYLYKFGPTRNYKNIE